MIVVTAIPKITDEFKSLDDIGWYGSAYMLTASASQLVYGRFYRFYSTKWVFIASITIFEIGSAICGAAPSSVILIIGRAIAGLGTGGIASGMILIIVLTVPLQQRPLFQGFAGSIFGIASVLGPILGGVFTTHLSWRWCFYINLPFGGIAIIAIFSLLNVSPPKGRRMDMYEKIQQLDPLGNLALVPSIICLLLAFEWGGSVYSWRSWRIIILFVLGGTLLIIFIFIEMWVQEKALVPPRIFKQRPVLVGFIWTTCVNAGSSVMLYYLPIWFQTIKNVDPEKSGIMNLPFVLSMVVGITGGGILVSSIGYYNPFMYLCTILMSTGAGLFTLLQPTTGHSQWIGYQVIFGFGFGIGSQQATVAVQTCLAPVDVAVGAALLMFARQLSGAVFLAVAETIFSSLLIKNLSGIPGLDAADVVKAGATAFRQAVPASEMSTVIQAYSDAITRTFYLGVAMSCLTIFGAVPMKWNSVKRGQKPKANESQQLVSSVSPPAISEKSTKN